MENIDRPVLITDAVVPADEQLAARKRRYTLLMAGRLVLFVLAAATYGLSPWLAAALLALSVPLPWMAVLIANDAPPRRTEDAHRVGTAAPVRALESRPHVVIDEPEAERAA